MREEMRRWPAGRTIFANVNASCEPSTDTLRNSTCECYSTARTDANEFRRVSTQQGSHAVRSRIATPADCCLSSAENQTYDLRHERREKTDLASSDARNRRRRRLAARTRGESARGHRNHAERADGHRH